MPGSQIGRAGISGVLAKAPVRRLGIGAGALVLAVSGLFGGLRSAGGPAVPVVAVSAVDQGVPWNVTVIRARVVGDLPPLSLQKPGDRWLLVLATIEVTAPESRADISEILRVPRVPGLLDPAPAYVVLSRDGTNVVFLNPGMPERVGFFWEQSGTSPLPTRIEVEIYGKTQRLDSLTGHLEWLDPAVRARVSIAVEDKRT